MGDIGAIRVVVVLESELTQLGLVMILNREPDIEVVGEAHNGAGAFEEVRRTAPDVVLVDVPVPPFLPPIPNDHYAEMEFPRRAWIDLFMHEARRVIGIAQDEARRLNHDFIGTEHILLGLIREVDGMAAQVLESLGIPLDRVRREVEEMIGTGLSPPSGHFAFTSHARQALELSHREALQLGRMKVGSEHILLGLIREGEGVAARVLVKLGADYARVRQQYIQILSGVKEASDNYPWTSILRELKDAFPRVGIVAVISEELTPTLASKALDAGATTYVSSIAPVENVTFAVRLANLTRP
jgi:DNA-binding NarL/FixJ family response regulator